MIKKSLAYDYIIVGAGSAGCVLANRLSANGKYTICLIEAGPIVKHTFARMPVSFLVASKKLNWNFLTEPQPYCDDRKLYLPSGKLLGGTSMFNGTLYVRGHPKDYDDWEKLGNPGWSYREVLPYFKKLEDFAKSPGEYHHLGGPVHVEGLKHPHLLTQAFLKAAVAAGYPIDDDFNGQYQEGVGLFDLTIQHGERSSNARAYLLDGKKRENLTIFARAQVVKLLFSGKRAIGARLKYKKKFIDIRANHEIILSAGSINSPKLLLLSGVGPEAELKKHQIPIVHLLQGVGHNLHDHLDTPIVIMEKTHHSISMRPKALLHNLKQFLKYFVSKTGEFAQPFCESGAFLKSDPNQVIPDIEWHFTPMMYANILNPTLIKKYNGYHIMVSFLHPFSRGAVTLRNSNPMTPPRINPNYLADERDLGPTIIGVKKARAVLREAAFAPYQAKEYLPGENIRSREGIINYIRHYSEPGYHLVGSCKMGCDDLSVVDARLKVHGLEGLRVIDASIMPSIISGNTNTPTTMIAEKGADMILEDLEAGKIAY